MIKDSLLDIGNVEILVRTYINYLLSFNLYCKLGNFCKGLSFVKIRGF